jgi:hypothetical protein
MEGSAMSAAAISDGNQVCRSSVPASEQGEVAEKTFAPAGTGPNIPRIPHFPRDGHPDPAGSGNVGKEGISPAASRPDQNDLGQGLVGLGAQMP